MKQLEAFGWLKDIKYGSAELNIVFDPELIGVEKLGVGKAASPQIGIFSECNHNNDGLIREIVGGRYGGNVTYQSNTPLQFSPGLLQHLN